jgi:hypothetical protein
VPLSAATVSLLLPERLARLIAHGLLLVHAGLAFWALVGFGELVFDEVPWQRLSNPLFSPGMLVLQWMLISLAALVFIFGYLKRWRGLPLAMLATYGAMALVCAYQTFFILTDPTRFRAMAIEYCEYAVILWFLFGSKYIQRRLSA